MNLQLQYVNSLVVSLFNSVLETCLLQNTVDPVEYSYLSTRFKNLLQLCGPEQGGTMVTVSPKLFELLPTLFSHFKAIHQSLECPDLIKQHLKRVWLTGLSLTITQSIFCKPTGSQLSTYTERVFAREDTTWKKYLPLKRVDLLVKRNVTRIHKFTDATPEMVDYVARHGSLEEFDEDEESVDWSNLMWNDEDEEEEEDEYEE